MGVSFIPARDSDGAELVRSRAFASADNFRFRGKGVAGTATKNATSNIDHTLTEERFINGVQMIAVNHVAGDKIHFEIVDKSRTYAGVLYPDVGSGEVVLDRFGEDWFLAPGESSQGQILLAYPARILAAMTIRIVYVSVGTEADVSVMANLFLHKPT